MILRYATAIPFRPVIVANEETAKAVGGAIAVPALVQLVPSALYSQSCELKPVLVFCVAYETIRLTKPVILNLITIILPFAELEVPPNNAKQAGAVVTVLNPVVPPAFKAVPVNEVNSVAGSHALDPLVPSRYIVPAPTLALYTVGELGATAAAVPPEVVVWKSQPASNVWLDAVCTLTRNAPNIIIKYLQDLIPKVMFCAFENSSLVNEN